MIAKIVHYKVKPEALPRVLEAIRTFVTAIRVNEPGTCYDAYQHSEDPFSFVHTMQFPDKAGEKAHQAAFYTQVFVEVLYPNCEILPEFKDLSHIAGTS
jgi:quinol monooxygenase YgiN